MSEISKLRVGAEAPQFTLPAAAGSSVSLSDFAGRKVVLYFYPKDDTTGCTREALDFTALKPDFDAEDAVILGVSKDPVARHERFASKHDLAVQLLSDADHDVCERYGVWVEKSMYGRRFMGIERTTFLVGVDGRIAQIWRKVKVSGHAQAVLEAARAL